MANEWLVGNCNSGYQSPKCSGPSGTSETELRVFPKALESEFMQCQEKACLQFTNVDDFQRSLSFEHSIQPRNSACYENDEYQWCLTCARESSSLPLNKAQSLVTESKGSNMTLNRCLPWNPFLRSRTEIRHWSAIISSSPSDNKSGLQ